MNYYQYLRIEAAAGGVTCTPRQFIRAAYKLLSCPGRSRNRRKERHKWLRSGLRMLDTAQQVYRHAPASAPGEVKNRLSCHSEPGRW